MGQLEALSRMLACGRRILQLDTLGLEVGVVPKLPMPRLHPWMVHGRADQLAPVDAHPRFRQDASPPHEAMSRGQWP